MAAFLSPNVTQKATQSPDQGIAATQQPVHNQVRRWRSAELGGCTAGSYNLLNDKVPHRLTSAARREVSMNRLAAILPATNVLVDVDATSKKRAFEHAGLVFENQHALARGLVTDNLFARERLGSTGLGHGVAIPHGRIKGLKNPLAAVLRVRQPIPFDAPDDEAVGLLIFLLVPEAATQRHLEILSEIAEMLSDRELRERLKTEPDAAQVHGLISRWEPLQSVA